MKYSLKTLGKITVIQALKSTGYVCLLVFVVNVLMILMTNLTDITKLGSNLISNVISWLWFGIFAVFESRKLENLSSDARMLP